MRRREGAGAALHQSELFLAVGAPWVVLNQGEADAVQPGGVGEDDGGPSWVERLDDLGGEQDILGALEFLFLGGCPDVLIFRTQKLAHVRCALLQVRDE